MTLLSILLISPGPKEQEHVTVDSPGGPAMLDETLVNEIFEKTTPRFQDNSNSSPSLNFPSPVVEPKVN